MLFINFETGALLITFETFWGGTQRKQEHPKETKTFTLYKCPGDKTIVDVIEWTLSIP